MSKIIAEAILIHRGQAIAPVTADKTLLYFPAMQLRLYNRKTILDGEIMTDRRQIADIIVERMTVEKERLIDQYRSSCDKIGFFFIDDLLPEDVALSIYRQFPKPETMKLKKTLREYKYIAAQMDQYDPILEESVYAFQDERIVNLVKEICGPYIKRAWGF